MSERKSALPVSQLDEASKKRLDGILGAEPTALTPADREFLFARRDYLTEEQREDYLTEEEVESEESGASTEANEDEDTTGDNNENESEDESEGTDESEDKE